MSTPRLLRITTVPISLRLLLRGQLQYMSSNGFDVLAASADGADVQLLIQEGLKHKVVPMTRTISPINDLICLIKLIRLIRKFQPQIVHTHTPKAGLLGMLAAWICRVPVRLHTVAGLPLMETKGLMRKLLILTERLTYACANRVYPNSFGLLAIIHHNFNSTKSDLLPNQIKKKFKVIGLGSSNGIDTSYFKRNLVIDASRRIRSDNGIPDAAFVFSFVGRIVKDKGIGELVEAFDNLCEKFGHAFLIIVGHFEHELDPLDGQTLAQLNSNPRIVLPGFQHDVRPWLVASDAFVFPSYREGFPNVVMQAACLEVPCIVSNINGCNELIRHNETGLVVEPKNSEDLCHAMQQLLTNPILCRQFAQASFRFVSSNFDQQTVWLQLKNEYHKLLSK